MASRTVASHFPAHKLNESVMEITDRVLADHAFPESITVWPARGGSRRLLMTLFLALLVSALGSFTSLHTRSVPTTQGGHLG